MTVSVTTASQSYTGDGATVNFPTVFVFGTSADIEVIERTIATGVETTKVLTTDFTVSGGGGAGAVPATGTVVANSAPASTVEWHIRRVIAETQGTALPTAGALPSASVENIGDRAVMMIQQHSEEFGRVLSFPKTDASSLDPTIPNSVDRASKYLTFDANGNPTVSGGASSMADGTAAAPGIPFVDDPDTGIYRPGANSLGIAAGGVAALVLNASGTPVNYFDMISADTGAGPALSALGGDTDIPILLKPKGTGTVALTGNAAAFDTTPINSGLHLYYDTISGVASLAAYSATGNGSLCLHANTGGGAAVEHMRMVGTGVIRISNGASWTANGSVATTLGSLGPAGIGTTTPTKWLTFQDDSGTVMYIPAWT